MDEDGDDDNNSNVNDNDDEDEKSRSDEDNERNYGGDHDSYDRQTRQQLRADDIRLFRENVNGVAYAHQHQFRGIVSSTTSRGMFQLNTDLFAAAPTRPTPNRSNIIISSSSSSSSSSSNSSWGLRGIIEDAKRGIRMPLVYFAAEIAVKRPRPNFEDITEMLRLLLWKDEGLLRTLQHSSGDDAKLPISIGAQCELVRALDFLHQREFQAKNVTWIVAECINFPNVVSALTAEYVLGSNGNSLARLNQAKIKLADQVSTVTVPTPADNS
mmetsp:Transcript_23165/g.38978  ORF Transcript_23165/g.38978 Transcript_23165/m.38978 type:complete len:270 (+) Transcript_23165:590-1399(+)